MNGRMIDMIEGNNIISTLDNFVSTILAEPLAVITILGVSFLIYRGYETWMEKRQVEQFEETDWSEETPERLERILKHTGKDTDKKLVKGDFNDLGKVSKYDIQTMPENKNFKDVLFNVEDDEDKADWKQAQVFLVSNKDMFSQMLSDLNIADSGKDNIIYAVDSDKVHEEYGRFKIDDDVEFREEYKGLFVQKGSCAENVPDQFPVYEARKSINEGLDEIVQKILFYDRNHTKKMAELREDVDEEALEKFLNQGRNM